jgi:hypothetical protein
MSSSAGVPVAEDASTASNPNLQELQETVSRLSTQKGVTAVLILNRQGDILAQQQQQQQSNHHNDGDGDAANSHAAAVQGLFEAATRHVQTWGDDDDQVSFVQVRTQQGRELYLAPHEGYLLAVLKQGS